MNKYAYPNSTWGLSSNKTLISKIQKTNCPDEDEAVDMVFAKRNIRRSGNHIYFYDGIDPETQMILQLAIKEAAQEAKAQALNTNEEPNIIIHVNSPGGVLHSGFGLYDYIKSCPLNITVVVEGLCASAATFILLAADTRLMSPTSSLLFHQLSAGLYWGDNRLIQDFAYNCSNAMNKICDILIEETEMYAEIEDVELRKKAITKNILEHDIEIYAEQAEKWGLIDTPEEEIDLSEENVKALTEYAEKLIAKQIKDAEKAKKEAEKAKTEKSKTGKDKKPAKEKTKEKTKKDKEE